MIECYQVLARFGWSATLNPENTNSPPAPTQPNRINPSTRIMHIPLLPQATRYANRIRAAILHCIRVVIALKIIVQTGLRIVPLIGKTQGHIGHIVGIVGGTHGPPLVGFASGF